MVSIFLFVYSLLKPSFFVAFIIIATNELIEHDAQQVPIMGGSTIPNIPSVPKDPRDSISLLKENNIQISEYFYLKFNNTIIKNFYLDKNSTIRLSKIQRYIFF